MNNQVVHLSFLYPSIEYWLGDLGPEKVGKRCTKRLQLNHLSIEFFFNLWWAVDQWFYLQHIKRLCKISLYQQLGWSFVEHIASRIFLSSKLPSKKICFED